MIACVLINVLCASISSKTKSGLVYSETTTRKILHSVFVPRLIPMHANSNGTGSS